MFTPCLLFGYHFFTSCLQIGDLFTSYLPLVYLWHVLRHIIKVAFSLNVSRSFARLTSPGVIKEFTYGDLNASPN